MKHIYKFLIAIAGALILLSSCSLDRNPYGSIPKEELHKDKDQAFKYMLNGCYSQLKAWSDEMHRVGEYAGDNIMVRGVSTDDFFPFIAYVHKQDNGRLTVFWNNSYRAIIQATDVINLVEEGTSDQYDYNLGEMYYIRGMVYFYLTRVFGRPYYQSPGTNLGVPIVLKGSPAEMEEIYAPDRSSVQDCYDRAISDLKKAELLMTNKGISKRAIFASKEAAQAMLSRVYLYMSGTYESPNLEYAKLAKDYAETVINSNNYVLLSRVNFVKYNEFAPNNITQTETIFSVMRVSAEYSGSAHYYGIGGMYANILGQGWGEMFASAKYLDLLKKAGYHKEDARWAFVQAQYRLNSVTKKPVEGFRFMADVATAEGAKAGYAYIQDTLRTKTDGSYFIKIKNVEYALTPQDAPNNLYTISYAGKTYTGEKDYVMLENNGHPMFYIIKCSLQQGESHLHSPIISRLAEMHLNAAEAYAKMKDYSNAQTQVNIIRERAVPGDPLTIDASNAKKLINEERQLELAFEAHRSFDVFRNGETLTRHYPGAHNSLTDIAPDNKRVVHYIPQKEINAYPGPLTQNPD